jgi:hypothetical protein
MRKLTEAQRWWLLGLRDDPFFDRDFKPHPATEASCERNGWAEYRRVAGSKMAWRITKAGRAALLDDER